MIVGIDYTPAHEQGAGIGRYVRELVTALASVDQTTTYRLFVAGAFSSSMPLMSAAPNFEWRTTPLTPRWLARMWHRASIPLPVEVFTGAVDLYHATDFVLPPTHRSTKTIVQVHDLSFVRVPESASPRLKAYLDRVVPASVHRSDHIIADSQATKEDIAELYHVQTDKITVLYGAVDPRFKPLFNHQTAQVRQKYGIDNFPFVLSVGTIQPRKNYERLTKAVAQLRNQGVDLHLVIAGGRGWLEDPFYETIRTTGMQPYVHLIGFVDEADLPALYSTAACFAFPSLYEGFGLPVLEAMACGVPVVTSNISSLPEVAGDAGVLVDPYSVDAIAESLLKVVFDTEVRETLIKKGFQQVKHFNWQSSARLLKNLYDQVLSL